MLPSDTLGPRPSRGRAMPAIIMARRGCFGSSAYLGPIDKHRTAKRLVRRLDALGYDVMLRPKAAA